MDSLYDLHKVDKMKLVIYTLGQKDVYGSQYRVDLIKVF